jgi:hypothetical protein
MPMKNEVDRWGDPIYKCDEDGFLLANFRALKVKDDEPHYFWPKYKFFILMKLTNHVGKLCFIRNHILGVW